LGAFTKRRERKRKSWTFERLEDRMVFSVTPQTPQVYSFSNQTAEGAALTLADEMYWAQLMYASQDGSGTDASNIQNPLAQGQFFALPNDPMFPNQWHLLNVGQRVDNPQNTQPLFGVAGEDIHVVPVWNMLDDNGQFITGKGVVVAVIDSGVQLFHPDLAENIDPTRRFNAANGTNNVNPDLTDPVGGHGTSVAGIIAAVWNNNEGGSGIAPDATIVPIKLDLITDQEMIDALLYAIDHDVDVTNNSYGFGGRFAVPVNPELLSVFRQAAISGRGGLGMINVFSSGNDAGPTFSEGFPDIGLYNSSSYSALLNSRYNIGVTGVDHDGLYKNADGTFTAYPVAGPNLFVAAPTGSNANVVIGDDDGFGSGIWTTDLFGDFGFNAAPLPNGFDPDNDFWPDPNYTSRFNGTSASAPMVTGVIALMLQANPNLTYRDVQEILVRSARQNAAFEFPTTGAGSLGADTTTWQINQAQPFRNPDFHPNFGVNPLYTFPDEAFSDPIADPNHKGPSFFGFPELAPDTNDSLRQIFAQYEPQPATFTNGAGYTVSQGYGAYGEQIGYAHGTIDAEAAVYMALHWDELNQNSTPELTFTTAVAQLNLNIPAAEKVADPPNGNRFLVPGGIGGLSGFVPYWNQYFNFTGPPFNNYTGPSELRRGESYLDFAVPPSQQMEVEWVEVKLSISGAGVSNDDLDHLRLMLTSPEGTQSELNNWYVDGDFSPVLVQGTSTPPLIGSFPGDLNPDGGNFVWTFSTNRNWGENSSSKLITHAVTGEPLLIDGQPVYRNWELHIENWSNSGFVLGAVEVIWHGKPVGGGQFDPNWQDQGILKAQRVQGKIGIDANGDNTFNYDRYLQTLFGQHADPSTIRTFDVQRQLDFDDNNFNGIFDEGDVINQEAFASNIVVEAFRVWNGVADPLPFDTFLTGADGNYYFDFDINGDLAQRNTLGSPHFGQTLEYEIRATDPLGRLKLNDIATPALPTTQPGLEYLAHYKDVWRINPNWFFAPDRDNPLQLGNSPGEVFFDPTGAIVAATVLNPTDLPEPGLPSPVPFDNFGQIFSLIPSPVYNLNFLLKQDAPPNSFNVTGTVYSDVNGDGAFNGSDAAASNVSVYWDKNRNGAQDPGEFTVLTNSSGQYTLPIDLSTLSPVPTGNAPYQIGVVKPSSDWTFTDPGQDGVELVFAGPGSPNQVVNFFIQPPAGPNDPGNGPGTIQGVIFNDLDQDGLQDLGEPGVSNFRVFIDSNLNGVWESATEVSVLSGVNGSFFFSNVLPGLYRIDIVIPNEGTPAAAWNITSPIGGSRDVQLLPGGAITGVTFGLENLAGNDFGDLPNSFFTTAAVNGPRHKVQMGFQLGATIDGEVDGVPSLLASSDTSDDGVQVISNSGILDEGVNTLRVTVLGVGGLLTGWMDFNNDGTFSEAERLTWTLNGTNLGGEADLNPGTYDLQITVPANAVDGRPMASRFRWGEVGLTFTGPAEIGEVEDYLFGLNYLIGDYNRNGTVDNADFVLWQKTNGQNVPPFSGADGNGDGVVNQADFDIWKANFGNSVGPGAGAGAGMALTSNSNQPGPTLSAADLAMMAEYQALISGVNSTTSGPTSVAPASSLSNPPAQSADVSNGGSSSGSSSATSVSSPVFVGFATTVSSSSSANTTTVITTSSASSESSDSDLLLLDQTWADLSTTSYSAGDDSLFDDESSETVSTNDLALAAVLKDDDEWWNSL
jgi:subtilisin family serine protease